MALSIGTFDDNDLADLQNFLIKLSDKWFDIGIQLGVSIQKLQNIRKDYAIFDDGLREMLIVALKEPLTWEMLSTALKSDVVGGKRLLDTESPPYSPSKTNGRIYFLL